MGRFHRSDICNGTSWCWEAHGNLTILCMPDILLPVNHLDASTVHIKSLYTRYRRTLVAPAVRAGALMQPATPPLPWGWILAVLTNTPRMETFEHKWCWRVRGHPKWCLQAGCRTCGAVAFTGATHLNSDCPCITSIFHGNHLPAAQFLATPASPPQVWQRLEVTKALRAAHHMQP